MSNQDGDLSEVAPELLELTKDPAAWREARKAAYRLRIAGGGQQHQQQQQQQGHFGQAPQPPQQQQNQSAVMAQLQALKRRGRDEGPDQLMQSPPDQPHEQARQPQAATLQASGSFIPNELREKLMRAHQNAQRQPPHA